MSKRFIVGLDSSTEEQNEAFLRYAKEQQLSWWHWLSNMWLLVDSTGRMKKTMLRDKLNETHPGIHNLVIELEDGKDSWAGLGSSSEEKNMFRWLHGKWKDNK